MKPFKSVAQWPDGTTSEDQHDTRAQAEGVCTLLKREGFGGERRVFPTRTEVRENVTLNTILVWQRERSPSRR